MSEIFCNSCLRSSISADGVSCFYCGSYETRQVFPSNLNASVPKPDNVFAEYHTPAADVLSQNVEEGSMHLEQASIPTKGNEFSSYVPVGQRHAQEVSVNNYCLPVGKTCNTFDQAFITNWNPMPVLPSEFLVSEIVNSPTDNSCTEYHNPADDVLTENVTESSKILDQASIQTKAIEFSSSFPVNQWHLQEIFIANVEKAGNTLNKDYTSDWSPANPPGSGDKNNTRKAPTKRPSTEILNKSSDSPLIKHPNVKASKLKSSLPADYFYAVPGPSGLQKMGKISKICEKLQSEKTVGTQSSVSRDDKKCTSVCNHISRPAHNGKKVYSCCLCTYKTSVQRKLQRHSYSHQPAKMCKICKNYYLGDSHNNERTCVVCEKIFVCKTQFNVHNLDHKSHFMTHCWGCCDLLENHSTKRGKKTIYICCVCENEDRQISHFISHNSKHRPKLFCEICKEEYDAKEKTLHVGETVCFGCKKTFQCKGKFEQYLSGQQECGYIHCTLCEKKIHEHRHTTKKKKLYKCCVCVDVVFKTKKILIRHLFSDAKLRLFKCDICSKRFTRKAQLNCHSTTCSVLPFKCEICEVPFNSVDSVEVHRVEKHY